MIEAVICEPVRLAVGGFGGMYRDIPVADLATTVMKGLIERTKIQSSDIDDVIFGQGYANGEAAAIGRIAALNAGLDVTVPGYQLDRRCGSGLQSVINAAMQVQTGMADLIVAGGAESMSTVEYYSNDMRWGIKGAGVTLHDRLARPRVNSGGVNYPVEGGMIETAENLRREYSISRQEQDEYSLRSHARAIAAIDAGKFVDEIIPMHVPKAGKKEAYDALVDEHARRGLTIEALQGLRPILGRSDPEATVTAGNASGQNDAASAAIVTTMENAERLGLKPFARLVSWGVAGVDPRTMGIGPVPAVAKAFARAGLTMADMDLIELNEAFAAQVLACTREWDFAESDFDRFNVNGGGISLGHPIGATGGRIMANLLREMDRREARYGLETMCIGGGQGIAAVFENLNVA